ncbi:NAC domain containing protein 96 [Euphorbia peplus]|nr:NAC domain containing protein 96 [Euphorbia peplus]
MESPDPLSTLVGYRFRPWDQLLIEHYLINKNLNPHLVDLESEIAQVKICDFDPWDLPDKSNIPNDMEWYFFSPLDFKYTSGLVVNRTTKGGYWKVGKQWKVHGKEDGVIGTKRELVFHKNSHPKAVITGWTIHEYESAQGGDYVLCKLMLKPDKKIEEAKTNEMASASNSTSQHMNIAYGLFPTDEEVVHYYLKLKMLGQDAQFNMIPEINLPEFEPWEIPGIALKMSNSNPEERWCFFYAPILNNGKEKRKTNAGFWKHHNSHGHQISGNGLKKILTFYEGRANNLVKTNWVIDQYYATFDFPIQENFTFCILRKFRGYPQTQNASNYGESSYQVQGYPQPQNASYYGGSSHQVPYNSGDNPTQSDEQRQAYVQSLYGYTEAQYSLNSAFDWPNGNNWYNWFGHN